MKDGKAHSKCKRNSEELVGHQVTNWLVKGKCRKLR